MEDDVQDAAERGAVITGTEETIKEMADLAQVVIAANIPHDLAARVRDAAEEHDVTVEEADADNHELGSLCMEPYATSVVGIRT